MKEKAVGLWNRIATKENKQIAKNVLLILLVSRLFYIFIGCVTNSAFGNNITFAKSTGRNISQLKYVCI